MPSENHPDNNSPANPKHQIIKWPKVLYPAVRSKNAAAIRRAVEAVVKPRTSFCICGRNCALNKKHVALLEVK